MTATQYPPRSRSARFSTPPHVRAALAQSDRPANSSGEQWLQPSPVIVQRRSHAVDRARAIETFSRIGVLLAVDLLILLIPHAVVNYARGSDILLDSSALLAELIPRGTFPRVEVVAAILLGLAIFGAYRAGGRWHRPRKILYGSTLGLSLVFWGRVWEGVSLGAFGGFALLLVSVAGSLVLGRALLARMLERLHPAPLVESRAIILGTSARAEHLKAIEAAHSDSRLVIVGHVTTDREYDGVSLGVLSDLVWLISRHNIDTIIIDGQMEDDALVDVLEIADQFRCTAIAASPSFPLGGFVPRVEYRSNIPYVSLVRPSLRWAQLLSKRAFDIFAAGALLLVLSPLLALVALAVRLSSSGPVLYRHVRVGFGGKRFVMYKFRSMVKNAEDLRDGLKDASVYSDQRVFKVLKDPRVTKVGRFLRRSSLDELPQLLNVLIGEMSMVGPRPPLATEVALYEEYNYSRFDMKPGITGPWQIAGRNAVTSFDDIVAIETAYLADWSLGKDVMILLKTVPAVLSMRGAV